MADPILRLKFEPRLDAKKEAFPYQKEAVDFVTSLNYAAIFHEQGLGKSKIAIDSILHWLSVKEVDTVVIFTKKILVANWKRELEAHSYLRPSVLTESSRDNYFVFTAPTRIIICHFEVAKKEMDRFKIWLTTRRVAAVLDESAKIKNPDSALTRAYFELAPLFKKRVIMTGTPVANRPYDIWAQIYFLDQGLSLGTDFDEFKRNTDFSRELGHDAIELSQFGNRLNAINKAIANFSIRETKNSGRIELPAKEFIVIPTHWEPQQNELYRQVKEDLRATVIRDGQIVSDDQESILKRLLRLIQIASNPKLVDESYEGEPGKVKPLYDLVSQIVQAGEKVIIWTTFNENCEYLTKKLKPFGSLALHGKLPIERRNSVVKWFLENESDRVLVATPGAAKEGLTLTVANHVVFYDRTYSLDDYLQSQDRIHRVSQTKTCYVYTMLMEDSVDEWIDALIEEKSLAAKLAQGDITEEYYLTMATMSFFEILDRVLKQDQIKI